LGKRRLDEDGMGVATERRIFRERLITRMAQLKLTSAELSRALKMSKDAISSYTTMRSLPTPETLARLATVLKCKERDLLPEKGELDPVIELRSYTKPGFKLLVVRLPLPNAVAHEYYGRLLAFEAASNGFVAESELVKHAPPLRPRGRPPKTNGASAPSEE